MEAPEHASEFISAGLASLGIEADDIDFAVMTAAHATFWPPIREMLALDLTGVEPETRPDLSQAPRREQRR